MNELDGVALTVDLPDQYLQRGQVGTIVKILDDGVYEVEFVDTDGKTYAISTLKTEQLIQLHYSQMNNAI